jgi:hypothetical protein
MIANDRFKIERKVGYKRIQASLAVIISLNFKFSIKITLKREQNISRAVIAEIRVSVRDGWSGQLRNRWRK